MPERITIRKQRLALFKDLGLVKYGQALAIQEQTLQSKIEDSKIPDHVYLLEHPCVFTLGKNGGAENLSASQKYLSSKNIKVVQTRRGGNITYHSPGQIVMYPIVDLEKNRIGIADFVFGLEEVMKRTAQDLGVFADRNPKNHGIWLNNSKLGSVGLGIKKGISYHGIALNITMDLTPFSWINPCGLSNVSMTSIQKELNTIKTTSDKNDLNADLLKNLSVKIAKKYFIKHFCSIFDYAQMQ